MTAQTMNYTVVINSAVWGGALAYYYIDARKWFTGPKITLRTDDLSDAQRQAIKDEGIQIADAKFTGGGAGVGSEEEGRATDAVREKEVLE